MAVESVAHTLAPVVQFWDTPPEQIRGGVPRGEITFNAELAIAEKTVDTDTMLITFTANFPRNFAYRVTGVQWSIVDGSTIPITEFEYGLGVKVIDGRPDRNQFFDLKRQADPARLTTTAAVLKSTHYGDDFNSLNNPILDSGVGQAQLVITIYDQSTDATPGCTMWPHITALIYDIEQINNWQVNYPVPVTT